MNIHERLLDIRRTQGAGYFLLVDPDKCNAKTTGPLLRKAEKSGVDGILLGGSLVLAGDLETTIRTIKENTNLPLILFPGSLFQISDNADAILFLVLISGRNPDHLIGNQVVASPIIKKMGLEAISTGYMLIESGNSTAALYMSNTHPIPRHKPDIAVAHALAAEYMGMKVLYLDAGSGAERTVPDEMIAGISKSCSLPIFVGGGIRTPDEAAAKVTAGASFIVTGTIFEEDNNTDLMAQFASAVHNAGRGKLS